MAKSSYLLKEAQVVNEGSIQTLDILIKDGRFEKIARNIGGSLPGGIVEIACTGKYVFPGIIDDQVHFREPGLTHKANIHTESRAAVAGGVTSFMEMPNTKPPATSIEELEKKYAVASKNAAANYSFFFGASNDNLEEVKKVDGTTICGIKIFMGSSTGNMLVDEEKVLEGIFQSTPLLIATHCEDEERVRERMEMFKEDTRGAELHPVIRDVEACYLSSSKAVALAKRFGSRLHVLHISTAKELDLFENSVTLEEKKITSEACVHHLSFSDRDYGRLGNKIKCNPAIKSEQDREAIWQAVLDGRIDVIATDHAPHTIEEKSFPYKEAPSGLPLVQHSFYLMYQAWRDGRFNELPFLAKMMAHNPARLFRIKERGFIREGYWADAFVCDPSLSFAVEKKNILYKCAWSPLDGRNFEGRITDTFVSGNRVWAEGSLRVSQPGQRLVFESH